MSIAELHRRKRHAEKMCSKANVALENGNITKEERDAFLKHTFNSSDEKEIMLAIESEITSFKDGDEAPYSMNAIALIAGFFVIMVSLFAVLFYSTGGITGAVVVDIPVAETYTADAMIPVFLNGTTNVRVLGAVSGLGDVTIELEHDGMSYVLYEYAAGPPVTEHASLASSQYTEGEPVAFTATNVTSAYLMTDTEAVPLGNTTTLVNLSVGEYVIKLIINDSGLVQEELPFTVVPIGTVAPSDRFDSCGEVCRTNLTGNATVLVSVSRASVTIDSIAMSSQENRAPVLNTIVPDIGAESMAIINLNDLFTDPDGDELYFESSHYDENEEVIEDGVLTIIGVPGAYTYVVYGSDLEELTSSNMFTVTFTSSNETVVNESVVNNTVPEPDTNVTLNQTIPVLNETIPAPVETLNCDNPDLNKRPVECLQENSDIFFQEQTILITNTDREPVARITPIGNLLLTGDYFDYDTFTPQDGDYVIGYEDDRGNYIVTIWFDSATGNLHMAGGLVEENTNLVPASGSFVIRNKKGVTLAWADQGTGTLYVRGNVIPYRRSLG